MKHMKGMKTMKNNPGFFFMSFKFFMPFMSFFRAPDFRFGPLKQLP
jgi:hypothetical protein